MVTEARRYYHKAACEFLVPCRFIELCCKIFIAEKFHSSAVCQQPHRKNILTTKFYGNTLTGVLVILQIIASVTGAVVASISVDTLVLATSIVY